jgi:hypothetical protein
VEDKAMPRRDRQHPVIVQLGRLALERRSGALRIPGGSGGTIHLYLGGVACAESRNTPDVASRLARWRDPGERLPSALERDWVIREATIDAALDMLTSARRSGRFTADREPVLDRLGTMTVAELLAEVNRRQELIRQLPTALTADTLVARNPRFSARGVHISAGQWALLVRMNVPVTPRRLAGECGRSVFTTTLEVFRLITVDLAVIADGSSAGKRPAEFDDLGTSAISFIRAAAGSAAAFNDREHR